MGQRLGYECDPALRAKAEKFESFPLPDYYASVRQLAGRKGEVWGAESRADKLFVLKSE
jgi:streptogramin lyase